MRGSIAFFPGRDKTATAERRRAFPLKIVRSSDSKSEISRPQLRKKPGSESYLDIRDPSGPEKGVRNYMSKRFYLGIYVGSLVIAVASFVAALIVGIVVEQM